MKISSNYQDAIRCYASASPEIVSNNIILNGGWAVYDGGQLRENYIRGNKEIGPDVVDRGTGREGGQFYSVDEVLDPRATPVPDAGVQREKILKARTWRKPMQIPSQHHDWTTWIGTDEAGKGDYFGPLAVAGVYVNPEIREILHTLGVRDGKQLSDSQVRKLAQEMRLRCGDNISWLDLEPSQYNELYISFRNKGQKLESSPCISSRRK